MKLDITCLRPHGFEAEETGLELGLTHILNNEDTNHIHDLQGGHTPELEKSRWRESNKGDTHTYKDVGNPAEVFTGQVNVPFQEKCGL